MNRVQAARKGRLFRCGEGPRTSPLISRGLAVRLRAMKTGNAICIIGCIIIR